MLISQTMGERRKIETYFGHIATPADAIKLFEACRQGDLPRVQRRLSEKERQEIRPGSVFVWDEREAGMRRWTDGKSWSASRVAGSFLTYREMEGKRGNGFGGGSRATGKTPDSGRGSDEDRDEAEPDGYRYKADGLIKQSFSITTTQGHHLHLIAYYTRFSNNLKQPTSDPRLSHIVPEKGLYPESSFSETHPSTMWRGQAHQPLLQEQQYGPRPPPQGYPPPPVHQGYRLSPSLSRAAPPYSHGHHPYPQGPPPPPPHGFASGHPFPRAASNSANDQQPPPRPVLQPPPAPPRFPSLLPHVYHLAQGDPPQAGRLVLLEPSPSSQQVVRCLVFHPPSPLFR